MTAFWHEDKLTTVDGISLTKLAQSIVTLWHPCYASLEEVQSWRNFMLEKEIKQPFKQAFREVYLVTDAEIRTSTYSNRFLDHILRHHKFAALAKQRLWTYANVYTHDDPYIDYPEFDISAGFDISSDYDFASTGRVHFRDLKQNEALRMEEVPAILFSETMRDMDLFVGVCSIGIEEEWHQNLHIDYWQRYSTTALSETALTRRDILTNMIPKLKIKDQCELTNKYLKIKGKIRTYKIHLGSGNILMEPNDQYLCIVPDRKKTTQGDKVFLPFDEDMIFSIIMSKAFLLADDDKITDPVILNQIHS